MNFDLITAQAIETLAEIEGVDVQTIFEQLREEKQSTTSKVFNLICAAMAQIEADRRK